MSGSAYRKEIDGLRALAVVPVVLFHFGISGFGGGFVGVDIFFVISGFLIGGLLWSELTRSGTIALRAFFMRRIRRLAPAYFAMAFVSLIAAWFILLPYSFREFGKELVAATVYLSNIHFFREAGYFDVASEQKVLLHTWSLSVEEQFYLFLPFALLLLRPFRQSLPAILVLIGVVSLLACVMITPLSQTATFYLFPFRAWELLAGVCLAIYAQNRGFAWSVHPGLSWAGLLLIAGSVAFIPSGPQFPGFYAIFPVLGAVLIIANGRDANPVNTLLQHPVLIFFGLISYSLYLWHWPVITLATYYADGHLGLGSRLVLMALTVLLAWLSLRLVETPIRRGALRGPVLFGSAALASVTALGAGAMIYLQDGMIDRFRPQVRTHIAASFDFLQDWSRCEVPAAGPFAGIEICPIGPDGPPQVVIWGDSHVRAFKEGLEQAAYDADTPALLLWQAGCPPLFGVAKEENSSTKVQNDACAANNAQIAQAFTTLPQARSLLLIGRWSYYAEGQGVGIDAHNSIRLLPAPDGPVTATAQTDVLAQGWDHTIDVLSAQFADIFILQQVPEITHYTSGSLARKLAHGHLRDPAEIAALTDVPRADVQARQAQGHAGIVAAAAHRQVHLIPSWDGFCDAEICSALHGGAAGYFDNNHVTNSTARRIRGIFAPAFAAAGAGT